MKSAGYSTAVLMGLLVPLTAAAGPVDWQVHPDSQIWVHVEPAGALAGSLHAHHFLAGRWSADLVSTEDGRSLERLDIEVDAASLRDQQQKLSAADRQKVENQVRSSSILDVERFPVLRFTADRLELDSSRSAGSRSAGTLVGSLEIHGVARPVRIPIEVEVGPGSIQASGRFSIRQADFGIRRFRKFLGAVAVKEAVQVEFRVRATPRGGAAPQR